MVYVITTPDEYTPCHYGTSKSIINDPTVNLSFMDVLKLDQQGFDEWLERVRVAILDLWDNKNTPPRAGLDEWGMQNAWTHMERSAKSDPWVKTDEGDDAILPTPLGVGAINQWFPTMMKTPITKSLRTKPISIYDMFSDIKIWKRYTKTYGHRHFQRDSFFHYSRALELGDKVPTVPGLTPKTAIEYVDALVANQTLGETTFDESSTKTYGLLFVPETRKDYTGYNREEMLKKKFLKLSADEVTAMWSSGKYPEHWFRAVNPRYKADEYTIRLYDSDAKIFPDGFKSFRISMTQFASNFPPLVAAALYKRFTQGVENPIVWDPSSGWGGRLTGALIAKVNYIGCDPNSDHVWFDENGTMHSKYTEIAAYYNSLRQLDNERSKVWFYPCGSEDMANHPEFAPFKGKLDLVFTSPPYFAKEVYSDDPAQSCVKFANFEDWCNGFLSPTIRTASLWLKPGGHLLWNIADAAFDGELLPLEARSIQYAIECGLVQLPTIKMLLTNMPGQSKISAEGVGLSKNTCTVNGKISKFEPILIFQKPY